MVDASVIVEFLAPGRLAEEADRLMEGLAADDPIALVAPDLLFLEVASALGRLARGRHLSQAAADRAVARLPDLPIGAVPSGSLVAGAWGLRQNATIYDAAYVALAEGLQVPFVTADRRLVKAARARGIDAVALDDPALAR